MKRPSSGALEQQLMMQRNSTLAQDQRDAAAFSAQRDQNRAASEAYLAAEEASAQAGIRKKIGKQVTLGTILTSPRGLLGNPILSAARLGG